MTVMDLIRFLLPVELYRKCYNTSSVFYEELGLLLYNGDIHSDSSLCFWLDINHKREVVAIMDQQGQGKQKA